MAAGRHITVKVLDHLTVNTGQNSLKLSPVERNLVALLAAAGPEGLDSERLADGLWADRLPPSWSASLRNSISRLNGKVASNHPDSARLISGGGSVRKLEVAEEAVDLWRLLDWAKGSSRPDEPGLLLGAPFPGCELPALLRNSSEQVVAARQDVVARWEAAGDALPNNVLASVRQLCADDPFNQRFIYSAVRLHLLSEHLNGARSILADAEAELASLGQPLSPDLQAVREQLNQQLPGQAITVAYPIGSATKPATSDDPAARHLGSHHTAFPDQPSQDQVSQDHVSQDHVAQYPAAQYPAAQQLVPPPPSPLRHSAVIERLAERPIAGRSELLSQIVAESLQQPSGGIALHGPAGIGKTRLAAEVALRLADAGFHTAYVVADQDMFGSLQPFLDTFRELRELVTPYLDQLHQPETNTKARTEMIGHLERSYAGRPLCLVVDDVQWLDAQSRSLLLSICRASLDIDVFCIVAGRLGDNSATWQDWVPDLGRTGLVDIRVRALDRETMHEMIDGRVPVMTRAQASRLVDQLLELSSGIPEVADRLLARVDRHTLEIATEDVDGTGYAAVISTMDPQVRSCGAKAALLGMRFSLVDLCLLAGLSELEAGRHVEALIDDGLLLELPMPDEFRFLHVLAAEALRKTLSSREQQELHAAAFSLFSDPHRRAWHGGRSVPITAVVDAAEALLASARLSYVEGDFPATSRNVDHAERLSRSSVSLDDQVLRLEALERSGIRATEQRALTTRRALDLGDHHAAVAAATSGLPDAETTAGDPDRIAVLQMIDQDRLSTSDRVHLNVHLSRQLLFVGRIDEAQRLADQAYAEAESPDELARTWMAAQLPGGLGKTETNPTQMPWFDKIQSHELRAVIQQAGIINAIGAGKSKLAYGDIVEQVALTTERGLPQLAWFAKVFQATALIDQGDHERAMAVAAETYRLGERAGLRIARGTYETQHFSWKLHEGSHGELYDPASPPGEEQSAGNLVFEAASAASLHAYAVSAGDPALLASADATVADVGRRAETSAFAVAVIGMLVDAIAGGGSPDLIRWASSRLAPMHGSYLLLASAAANLGPVAGMSARLAVDLSDKVDLFRVAIAVADDDELSLWQVLGRLRLRRSIPSGDSEADRLFAEAKELAVTPWLSTIVAQNVDD